MKDTAILKELKELDTELSPVFDETWEEAEPGAQKILKDNFNITWAEIHSVDGIIYNGKVVKNGYKKSEKPLILYCNEYTDEDGDTERTIRRTNYSFVQHGARPFIIPDDTEDTFRGNTWEEFFKFTRVEK